MNKTEQSIYSCKSVSELESEMDRLNDIFRSCIPDRYRKALDIQSEYLKTGNYSEAAPIQVRTRCRSLAPAGAGKKSRWAPLLKVDEDGTVLQVGLQRRAKNSRRSGDMKRFLKKPIVLSKPTPKPVAPPKKKKARASRQGKGRS